MHSGTCHIRSGHAQGNAHTYVNAKQWKQNRKRSNTFKNRNVYSENITFSKHLRGTHCMSYPACKHITTDTTLLSHPKLLLKPCLNPRQQSSSDVSLGLIYQIHMSPALIQDTVLSAMAQLQRQWLRMKFQLKRSNSNIPVRSHVSLHLNSPHFSFLIYDSKITTATTSLGYYEG